MDGGGVDVWRGSLSEPRVTGAIMAVESFKRDAEVKLLVGCTPAEAEQALTSTTGSARVVCRVCARASNGGAHSRLRWIEGKYGCLVRIYGASPGSAGGL